MNGMRRKAIVVLAGMGAAAALAELAVPTKKMADGWETDLEVMFPTQFGDWQVDRNMPVILPAPDVQATLDAIYNQVLARTYFNRRTDARVMLSVAYGGDQSDSMQVHLPEVCYPAQGFELASSSRDVLTLAGRRVPVKRINTRLGGRHEPVTYWLTLGETVAADRTELKINQLRYGLRGLVPDGMLVRMSSIDRDPVNAYAVQDQFAASLAQAMDPKWRPRVFGAAPTAHVGE